MQPDEKWRRITDTARNLLYPLVPFVAIGCVWAVGWARSVESRCLPESTASPILSNPALLAEFGPGKLRIVLKQQQAIASANDTN